MLTPNRREEWPETKAKARGYLAEALEQGFRPEAALVGQPDEHDPRLTESFDPWAVGDNLYSDARRPWWPPLPSTPDRAKAYKHTCLYGQRCLGAEWAALAVRLLTNRLHRAYTKRLPKSSSGSRRVTL